MTNAFLSKKIIVPAVIFFGGLLIAAGILISANLATAQSSVTSQSAQWTENTGVGISIPACASGSAVASCDGSGGGRVDVSWADFHMEPTLSFREDDCTFAGTQIFWGVVLPTGVRTFTGLKSDTWHCFGLGDGLEQVGFTAVKTPNCAPPLPTADIKANGSDGPITIPYNTSVNAVWSSTNADACTVTFSDAGGSWSGTSGNQTHNLTATRTYNLSCTGPGGNANDSVTVNVNPPPPGDFNLSIGGGLACNSVPLSWTASVGADGYRILRESPRVDLTPYNPYTALNFTDTTVSQNTSYRYQIEAYNSAGTNRSNARNVTTPYCPPTLDFSGDPIIIFEGQSSTLTWSSTFTTSCTASGAWSGSKGLNGSEIVTPLPPPSVTYNLQCSGPGGTTPVQPITITITPLGLPGWKEIIPR